MILYYMILCDIISTLLQIGQWRIFRNLFPELLINFQIDFKM